MDNVINTGRACHCKHHSPMPLYMVLFGLAFLLRAIGALSAESVSFIWPILVIAAGLSKMAGHKCNCCGKA